MLVHTSIIERMVEHTFGIGYHSLVSRFPVNAIMEILDICIRQNDVSVAATLCKAFTQAHSAIRQLSFVTVYVNKATDHKRLADRVKQCE